MKYTFLDYVAKDMMEKFNGDFSKVAVVFPNKRASLFLNRAIASVAQRPVWSPAYITISELFRKHTTLNIPDDIELVFTLYDVYSKIMQTDESLDHFYGWGQTLLADFDDLDKNMVDADQLFSNIKALQDMVDFSFLTSEQRKSLEQHFGSEVDKSVLKPRFTKLWMNLPHIYHEYRAALEQKQLAYEGMLYRQVAENSMSMTLEYDTYIFLGFNLLQQVEQRLFTNMKLMNKAMFYWDYDAAYIEKEAGKYIREYLSKFPNELRNGIPSLQISKEEIYHNMERKKHIEFFSATSDTIQASYTHEWLQHQDRAAAGCRTAIVMADENMLQQVVRSLPESVGKINITTGFPIAASPVSSLVNELLSLQLSGRPTSDKYRLKYVLRVLRHPLAKYISENSSVLIDRLLHPLHYYPTTAELTALNDDGLNDLFGLTIAPGNYALLGWLCSIFKRIGIAVGKDKDPLLQESVFRMFKLLNRLEQIITTDYYNLNAKGNETVCISTDNNSSKRCVSISVLRRLMQQLIRSTSVPFHGEPAEGVQIMGVLETRNLDFDHVLLLSCNEGNLPKGVNDNSIIPHTLRLAYGMTTVENKVGIYSYYYHALLQRAEDVAITYNNATDDGQKGEMSRFMIQMLTERNDIKRKTLLAEQDVKQVKRVGTEKTDACMDKLMDMEILHPTYINKYLRCPMQFYYSKIMGLQESEDFDGDEPDKRMFGSIFHDAAQYIYTDLSQNCSVEKMITEEEIDQLLKDRNRLENYVDRAFSKVVFHADKPISGSDYNGLQLLNRNIVLKYIEQLLIKDKTMAPFAIVSLEQPFYANMTIQAGAHKKSLRVGGYIDRIDKHLDEQGNTCYRIVDYKTGAPSQSAPAGVEDLFNPEMIVSKHTDYYIQTFIYAHAWMQEVRKKGVALGDRDHVSPALLFVRGVSDVNYDPVLQFTSGRTKERINDIKPHIEPFNKALQQLIEEIYDQQQAFGITNDLTNCAKCPYNMVCRE